MLAMGRLKGGRRGRGPDQEWGGSDMGLGVPVKPVGDVVLAGLPVLVIAMFGRLMPGNNWVIFGGDEFLSCS